MINGQGALFNGAEKEKILSEVDNRTSAHLNFVCETEISLLLRHHSSEVKETMDTPSSEGLTVHLDVSVLYHLDPTKAPEVYRSIGLNYESVVVVPNVRSAVRETTSSYEAKALYSPEREKMSSEINQHILAAIEPRGITIERLF